MVYMYLIQSILVRKYPFAMNVTFIPSNNEFHKELKKFHYSHTLYSRKLKFEMKKKDIAERHAYI